MPLTMLNPSDHHVVGVPGSIVAVIPVAEAPETHWEASIAFCDDAGDWPVTVPAVAHRFSWIRVWLVVVTESWLVQQRVHSAAVRTGTSTWLTVIAVDVATDARIRLYSPLGAAIVAPFFSCYSAFPGPVTQVQEFVLGLDVPDPRTVLRRQPGVFP